MHNLEQKDIRVAVYILLHHMTVNFTQFTTDRAFMFSFQPEKNTLLISSHFVHNKKVNVDIK